MTAFYNDCDTRVAAWLRELATQGHVTDGPVDERSIKDLTGDDVRGFRRVHFFAGIGGWDYALKLAGWPDDRPVWTGSCPCQPFSAAGRRGGAGDERHLWPEFFRLIEECRPPVVFGEQVASADGRAWLAGVRADLEQLGYAVGAADLCAAGVGAHHIRQRLWWVAHADGIRLECAPSEQGVEGQRPSECRVGCKWWKREPEEASREIESVLGGVAHGLPARVVRLRGYGNAIVPQVAATFIRAHMEAAHAAERRTA